METNISKRLSKKFLRSNVFVALLLLTMLIVPIPVWAAVSVDTVGFNPNITGGVSSMTPQPDGKILIQGDFTAVDGVAHDGLTRLNYDGSLDPSFDTNITGDYSWVSVVLQPDGKILIGGDFTAVDGVVRNGFARLNSDGTLDQSFDPNVNGSAYPQVIQPDDKILISGSFTEVDGVVRNGFARLNSDGKLDTNFDPNVNGSAYPTIQPDGKILILGNFTQVDGVPRDGFARINADGSLDPSFEPEASPYNSTLLVQPDGKILIVTVTINVIVRLNADGSIDDSFNSSISTTWLLPMVLQVDGKILVAGDAMFTPWAMGIVRLNHDGSLDNSFIPGPGIGSLSAMALQHDGKVLVVTGVPYGEGELVRLNPDGSIDTGFNPSVGTYGPVDALALQPDGKVLIGGNFSHVNGIERDDIARLNVDGRLDPSFAPVLDLEHWSHDDGIAKAWITSMLIQPDGKVLIGGRFSGVNGIKQPDIARLNTDGSLDTSFVASVRHNGYNQPSGEILALQPDGKVLAKGTLFDRFNTDGSRDSSFHVNFDFADFQPFTVALQPDGKMLISGSFTQVDGVARDGLARLNANGSLDASFDPETGGGWNTSLALQPDGKVLVSGSTSIVRLNADGSLDPSFNSTAGGSVLVLQPDDKVLTGDARLNSDGSLDSSFNSNINGSVSSLALQPDGKILIGGNFTEVDGVVRNNIAQLNADGSLDTSLYPETGVSNWVQTLAVQPDNKLLIGGFFTDIDGISRNRIARLNPDRSIDTSFDPGTGANDSVRTLALQPDGKVLIGGDFTAVDGLDRNHIARLNANGSLDTDFHPVFDEYSNVRALAHQPDGKVLVGGWFGIVRLNMNGSLDSSFDLGSGADGGVYAIAQQPDGKIIIGGNFTQINSVTRSRIARLNTNGSLDASFNPGTEGSGTLYALALQPDGKVLVGGNFTDIGGVTRHHIARLNSNGSVDTSFNPGTSLNHLVLSLTQQADGKAVIGGFFTDIGGVPRNRIARLNANGSLDTDFDPGTGANESVETIALQGDGSVVIGGHFTEVNGIEQKYISRLSQSEAALQQLEAAVDGQSVAWLRDGTGPVLERVTIEISNSLYGGWTILGSGQRTAGGWTLDGLNLPTGENVYIRARGYYGTGASSMTESILQFYLEKPSIQVSNTANPSVLKEPGGTVTFNVAINNTSATNTVTINTLKDTFYGNLNGEGNCSVPRTIAAGSRYNCAFDADITGSAGISETNTVTASGADEYGNPVSDSDSATVKIIPAHGCFPYIPKGKMLMICW